MDKYVDNFNPHFELTELNQKVKKLEKENARLREKLKERDQLLKEIVEVVPQLEYNYYLNKIKQGKEE